MHQETPDAVHLYDLDGLCGKLCYADCDENGGLDFFDYLCFQNHFVMNDPYADCDGNGTLDIIDFLCFDNAFSTGCP